MTKQEFDDWMKRHPSFIENVKAFGKKLGHSELAMHVGLAGHKLQSAYVDDRQQYAYALADNGQVVDGSWHEHSDDVSIC
jgi:hypothetical protein